MATCIIYWGCGRHYLAAAAAGPGTQAPSIPGLDKVAHFGVYAIAAVCGRFARWPIGVLALFLIAHGIVTEVLQGVGGVRTPEALDAVADAVGVIGGIVWVHLWSGWWRRRKAEPVAINH